MWSQGAEGRGSVSEGLRHACEDGRRIYAAVWLGNGGGAAGERPPPGSSGPLSGERRLRAEMFTTVRPHAINSAAPRLGPCLFVHVRGSAGAQWRSRRPCQGEVVVVAGGHPSPSRRDAGGWICARVKRPANTLEK